jgi:two-component system, chemotaxis family, protein-glutamate methylesterase/glutaminase
VRLARGPKEHHTRPAIDPLFRSAALAFGRHAIGVVLTGRLDDGTAGLQAIKRGGGTAVIQDPAEAETPSMPLSAQRYVQIDHTVPLLGMGGLLAELAGKPVPAITAVVAQRDGLEHDLVLGKGRPMEHLEAIGRPSTLACPDCQGVLWELDDTEPRRFRCHTGHAYTLRSLQHAHAQTADEALWSALRALQEKEALLKRVAESHRAEREHGEALRVETEAEEAARHGKAIRQLIQSLPPPPE